MKRVFCDICHSEIKGYVSKISQLHGDLLKVQDLCVDCYYAFERVNIEKVVKEEWLKQVTQMRGEREATFSGFEGDESSI